MATYTGDQGWADIALADGDIIDGSIYNCRIVTYPVGAVIYLREYDGVNHGSAHIKAVSIILVGTANGNEKGHGPGGGAGGAEGGSSGRDCAACVQITPGGAGDAGGADGGTGGCRSGRTGGTGGTGGSGGGPYGGAGGVGGAGDSNRDEFRQPRLSRRKGRL